MRGGVELKLEMMLNHAWLRVYLASDGCYTSKMLYTLQLVEVKTMAARDIRAAHYFDFLKMDYKALESDQDTQEFSIEFISPLISRDGKDSYLSDIDMKKELVEFSRHLTQKNWAILQGILSTVPKNNGKDIKIICEILKYALQFPEVVWEDFEEKDVFSLLTVCQLYREFICKEVDKRAEYNFAWKCEMEILKKRFLRGVDNASFEEFTEICQKYYSQKYELQELHLVKYNILEFILSKCHEEEFFNAFILLDKMNPFEKLLSMMCSAFIKCLINDGEKYKESSKYIGHFVETCQKLLYFLYVLPKKIECIPAIEHAIYLVALAVERKLIPKIDCYGILLGVKNSSLYSKLNEGEKKVLAELPYKNTHQPLHNLPMERIFQIHLEKENHFFDSVLDHFFYLIDNENFDEVNNILETYQVEPWRPLILIEQWLKSCNITKTQKMFENLWSFEFQNNYNDYREIYDLCNDLSSYTEIADWISKILVSKKKVPRASINESGHREILDAFLHNSPLKIISEYLRLRDLQRSEVFTLLQSAVSGCSKMDEVQKKDLMVYHGYCAIVYVADAILCSSTYYGSDTVCQNLSIGKSLFGPLENDANHSENRSANVRCLLAAASKEIENIFPIAFRIEILENIFSLIFLTKDQLYPEVFPVFLNNISMTTIYDSTAQLSEIENDSLAYPKVDKPLRSFSESEFYGNGSNTSYANKSKKQVNQSTPLRSKSVLNENGDSESDGFSMSSSNLSLHQSFLCSNLFLQEFFVWFKNTIVETSFNLYNEKKKIKDQGATIARSALINDTVGNSIRELDQFVSEAQWRFELVASEKISEIIEQRIVYKLNGSSSRSSSKSFHTSHCHALHSSSSVFQNDAIGKSFKKTDKVGNNDPGVNSGSSSDKRKRKNRKSKSSSGSLSVTTNSHKSSVISRMLSSPVSLVNFCLINEQDAQAEQVIKLFNLHDSFCAKEVEFNKKLKETIKKITHFVSSDKRMNEHFAKIAAPKEEILEKSIRLGLTAVARAAAEGQASTKSTSLVEELLSSVTPSKVFDASVDASIITNSPLLQECLQTDVLVITDLSLTSASSLDVCNHLMDLACSKISRKSKYSHRSSDIPGFMNFFQRMCDLLEQVTSASSSGHSPAYCKGLPSLLTQAVHPLSANEIFQQTNFWMKLKQIISEMSIVLNFNDSKDDLTMSMKKNVDPRVNFKKLIYSCSLSADKAFLPFKSTKNEKYDYLLGLYDYIRQLTSVLQECDGSKVQVESFFRVMEEGPSVTIGNLAIKNGMPPEKLEPLADKLHLDLTAIFTNFICPPIENYQLSLNEFHTVDRTILNKPEKTYEKVTHPELLARQLLSDITDLMQEISESMNVRTSFTTEVAEVMVQLPQCQNLLKATEELAYVDLDLLQTDSEKIAFYINVLNLMWIHGILHEILKNYVINKQPIKSGSFSSEFNGYEFDLGLLSPCLHYRCACQASTFYRIGQLGEISYLDLRYGLLRIYLDSSNHIPMIFSSYIEEKKNSSLWLKYAPPVEIRSLFVLAQGFKTSPSLSILMPDMSRDQLETAMSTYLNMHVFADCNKRQVYISKLLIDHEEDFCYGDELEAQHAGLLNFISSNVDIELSKSLNSLISLDSVHGFSENIDDTGRKELPFAVNIYQEDYTFNMKFSWHPVEEYVHEKEMIIAEKKDYVFGDLAPLDVPTSVIDYVRFSNPLLSYFIKECSTSTTFYCEANTKGDINLDPLVQLFSSRLDLFRTIKGPLQQILYLGTFAFNATHLWLMLDELSKKSKWLEILMFIDQIPLKMCNSTIFNIRDGVLCMILKHVSTSPGLIPWSYALQIRDSEIRCKKVMMNLIYWPIDICMKVLQECLRSPDISEMTRASLINLLDSMKVYFDALAVLRRETEILKISNNLNLSHWTNFRDCALENIDDILEILLSNQEYDAARALVKELKAENDFLQSIDECQLNAVLLTENYNQDLAVEILSKYDCEKAVLICLKAIKTVQHENVLYIIEYMLNNLKNNMDETGIKQLVGHKLGLKILQCIPNDIREHYENLVLRPHLMIEQLIMNSEVDLVKKCLRIVSEYSDFNSDNNQFLRSKILDELYESYALKALDVRIVRNVDSKLVNNESSGASSYNSHQKLLYSQQISYESNKSESFVMPSSVPKHQDWVPDQSVSTCMVCKFDRFSMVNRRHHCRRCGRVVCTTCSNRKAVVPSYGDFPVRVCDECCEQMSNPYSSVQNMNPGMGTSPNFEKRLKTHMRGSSFANTINQSTNVGLKVTKPVIYTEDNYWELSMNETHNDQLRNEFSYDQAPSISLCLSLLDLHSVPRLCGEYMLTLCDHLETMLMPIGYKQANPEVDYGLVVSMMKSLLLSAKVRFSEDDNASGIGRSDIYLQCVALLSVLARANCNHLIPSEKLTNNEAIRRLRDYLIEEERWPLALELSMKAGLEVAGIWASWGKLCLLNNDFNAAREKFSHCLKASEKNHGQKSNPLLNTIIKQLESLTFSSINKDSTIMKTISNLKKLQNSGPSAIAKAYATQISTRIYTECMHYLKTYGSHHHLIYFFVRHKMFEQAINFMIEKKCDEEVFVESFLIPCVERSKMSEIENKMAQVSPKLTKLSTYLIAGCRVLDKLGLHHLLYRIQVYMKDHIRAAMMCIKFFEECSTNYTDQFLRIDFLQKANEHLHKYLDLHEKWNNSKHTAMIKSEDKHCLMLPAREVNRHINTVDLQITTTKFLKRCEDKGLSTNTGYRHNSASSTNTNNLHTLFGNSLAKAHLCATVLLSGSSISDGFGIACRIMQNNKLKASKVYLLVTSYLVKKNLISEIFILLQCIHESGYKNDLSHDEVLFSAVQQTLEVKTDPSDVEELIKKMNDDSKKVSAYIICGKLTPAYLLAIKRESESEVQRILSTSIRCGQIKVKNICEKWLSSRRNPK